MEVLRGVLCLYVRVGLQMHPPKTLREAWVPTGQLSGVSGICSVERGGAGGRPAGFVVGAPSGGKGTWHLARLPTAALVSARGGREARHIGGAESARWALRCGPRREHWHR